MSDGLTGLLRLALLSTPQPPTAPYTLDGKTSPGSTEIQAQLEILQTSPSKRASGRDLRCSEVARRKGLKGSMTINKVPAAVCSLKPPQTKSTRAASFPPFLRKRTTTQLLVIVEIYYTHLSKTRQTPTFSFVLCSTPCGIKKAA